jgi:hypothetical protein
MANWAWKPNNHFGSFSSSMACGKAALSMKKRIQPFRAIPDKSAPAWHPVGSLQPQRAPTPPAALDEIRAAAINNLKPFTWTAETDEIIAAVSRVHPMLDAHH